MRAVAAMVRRSWGYWWGRIVPKRPHIAVTSFLCCSWDEPGSSAGRHVGEPGVAGDPGHRRGGGTWSGEVDPRGVERLPGATTRQGVGGDDGSGGADVVRGRRPVGVVTLQGVELGEDFAVQGRFDGRVVSLTGDLTSAPDERIIRCPSRSMLWPGSALTHPPGPGPPLRAPSPIRAACTN